MKNFTENDWASWQYDNGPLHARSPSDTAKFKTVYTPTNSPIGTLWEEAVKGAKSTLDIHSGLKTSILLRGGVDNEMMIRTFLYMGCNPNVYVVRYEDDINIYDVSNAVSIANRLGIDIKIIVINI